MLKVDTNIEMFYFEFFGPQGVTFRNQTKSDHRSMYRSPLTNQNYLDLDLTFILINS